MNVVLRTNTQGLPRGHCGSVSILLGSSNKTTMCFLLPHDSPWAPLLTILHLFPRRKKGMPRGRRKKVPPFKMKKPPSLLQPRMRRWRCQGRAATRRRWLRRQKVSRAGAVAGGALLSIPGFATPHVASPSLQMSVLTAASLVTPKSHQGDSVPQHKVLVAFWMPLDFMLARSVLDHCPLPVSVWTDGYFWEPLATGFHQQTLQQHPAYPGLARLCAHIITLTVFPSREKSLHTQQG